MTLENEQPAALKIRTIPMGLLGANAYLVEAGRVVMIDPGGDPAALLPSLPKLDAIICTHGHFDHIAGGDALRRATGAPLMIHRADAAALTDPYVNASRMIGQQLRLQPADRLLEDGDELPLGSDHRLRVLSTPGHTPGGICLLLFECGQPIALFSGDTLFQGSIGRLDIGGDAAAMQVSLEKLKRLPDTLPVYPGHGPATTIGRERATNPYLKNTSSWFD